MLTVNSSNKIIGNIQKYILFTFASLTIKCFTYFRNIDQIHDFMSQNTTDKDGKFIK